MTESLGMPQSASKLRAERKHGINKLFLLFAANAALWISALAYLTFKQPTYTSDWTINLPGAESKTAVSVPNIGQASSEVQSPYSNDSQDPRENYKFIAASKPVQLEAASQLNIPVEDFGEPQAEIIDSSTLMTLKVSGNSPEEAQAKSFALYRAIEKRLRQLRLQEAEIENTSFKEVLGTSQRRLQESQKRLSEYKARSRFSSDDQVTNLSSNIEQLRKEQASVLAQQKDSDARLRQLSANLNLSPQQATEAFSLQTDPYFQQALEKYGESSTALADLSSKYTPENPALISQKANRDALRASLRARSQSLLGKPVTLKYTEQLNLNNSSSRQQLFQELVSVQAEKQGLQAQAKETHKQLALLESRLQTLSQQQAKVDDLRRNVQIAEAIFSSTLTNLDPGKSYNFGSYPPIQLLAEPSLPKTPSAPNKVFILLGTISCSLFLTTGLVSIWLRKHQFESKRVGSIHPKEMPL